MQAATKPTVIVIPPDPAASAMRASRYHQMRVAAYCRVSTEEEEQLSSYEAQCRYYTDKINSNREWTMAKQRKDFLRMIRMCEKGKIDLILTKSISRFARNTVDALQYIRKLRSLGIAVIFEKESIDTSTMTDETILTVMSMFAQAESESISKAVSSGQRYRYREGKVRYCYPIFGYTKGDDNKPVINEDEAVHVRSIFRMFLDGNSIGQIKDYLESMGALTAHGKTEWSSAIIRGILKNEKYIGDAILQKTYVEDCISKRVKVNNGVLPKYIVKDNHPAIIDRATFAAVQEEIARRNSRKAITVDEDIRQGKFSGKYALTELMICDECGTSYRRTTWCRRSGKQIVWRCVNRLEHGSKYCKNAPTVKEEEDHAAIMRVINRYLDDGSEFLPLLKKNLTFAINGDKHSSEMYAVEAKISELKDMMMKLVDLAVKSEGDNGRYDAEFERIGSEIKYLTEIQESEKRIIEAQGTHFERVDNVYDTISAPGYKMVDFDNTVVRKLIECVKVTTDRSLKIYFRGGGETVEHLDAT